MRLDGIATEADSCRSPRNVDPRISRVTRFGQYFRTVLYLVYTMLAVMDTVYVESAPLASAAKTVDRIRFLVHLVVRSNP